MVSGIPTLPCLMFTATQRMTHHIHCLFAGSSPSPGADSWLHRGAGGRDRKLVLGPKRWFPMSACCREAHSLRGANPFSTR